MKLRIQDNTLRVRLNKTEVAHLAAGGQVTQTTAFSASSQLISSVETSDHAASPTATFDAGRMTIVLPLQQARDWAESDRVSIEADQPLPAGRSLRLLIEKDFECLHRREKADEDTFTNPRRSTSE